ncbi:MAG: prepilin-type N-terminal cleavage/methylation domain-containing protein [Phycisphaerales bacterium]
MSERIRVLMVCLGNICRSPLAKAVLLDRAGQRGVADRLEVDSCGTGNWHVGGPADPRTITAAHRHRVELSHTARQFDSRLDPAGFDFILAMDRANRGDVLRMGAPEARVHLLRSFDPALVGGPEHELDVPDPYTGDDDAFDRVYAMLVPACDGFLDAVLVAGEPAAGGTAQPHPATPRRLPAFTLIELLVVIAIVALLVSVLLPALGGARWAAKGAACLSRTQQLGVGVSQYLSDFHDSLPQVRVPVAPGVTANIGALFGGKKGTLPAYGINTYGGQRRPLNTYVFSGQAPPDDSDEPFELEAFRSPGDAGGTIPGIGPVLSLYDLLGSSYTLNDHALDGEEAATLIPAAGGRMPPIFTPTKTWLLGAHPIYNHQEGGDRGMRWYGRKAAAAATLLFADFHAAGPLDLPPGVVNTTDRYTFLPRPDWLRP